MSSRTSRYVKINITISITKVYDYIYYIDTGDDNTI